MSMSRRQILRTASVSALPFYCGLQAQTSAALELVKIVSGFPPGGTVDVIARRVADKLRGKYATNAMVENKPGAAGQIGILTVKDSPADGSVLLLTPSSMLSIYPFTYPKLQYNVDDVVPVSLAAYGDHALAVGPGVPASVSTLKQFLDWVKANPEKGNFGSPGAGSMPHMVGALVSKQSGVSLNHIPYRGTVPGIQDLLGGQISSFWGPIGDYLAHAKSGKLRVLAVSGKTPNIFLPGVPTLRAQGFDLAVREWYGFFLPGKASAEVIRRAAEQLAPVFGQPDLVDYIKGFGLEAHGSSPSHLRDLLQADAAEWRQLIRQIGFTAES